jgi:hypothetical protein
MPARRPRLHLASAGLDVLVLEKSQFLREKVCGDGLTQCRVEERDRASGPLVAVREAPASSGYEVCSPTRRGAGALGSGASGDSGGLAAATRARRMWMWDGGSQ